MTRKRSDGRIEYLVSCKGYPSKFNSLVSNTSVSEKMSRFTMTLPSNSSMNYNEDNTAAQFTTKLAQTIELDGDWEVGLSSIGVLAEVENVIAKEGFLICTTMTFRNG